MIAAAGRKQLVRYNYEGAVLETCTIGVDDIVVLEPAPAALNGATVGEVLR